MPDDPPRKLRAAVVALILAYNVECMRLGATAAADPWPFVLEFAYNSNDPDVLRLVLELEHWYLQCEIERRYAADEDDFMSSDLRMFELNTVHITGRLTCDPELRYTGNGTAVTTLRIAHGRDDKVGYFDVVVWEKIAEFCATNLGKGRPICVEGRLQQRSWEKDGQKRNTVEIVAFRVHSMDWPADRDQPDEYEPPDEAPDPSAEPAKSANPADDDDVPF